jgi:hypothetical protein
LNSDDILDLKLSQEQIEYIKSINNISFSFVPISCNINNYHRCCNTQCNVTPTYYLESNLTPKITQYCIYCKEECESRANDNNYIDFQNQEWKLKKSNDVTKPYTSKQWNGV